MALHLHLRIALRCSAKRFNGAGRPERDCDRSGLDPCAKRRDFLILHPDCHHGITAKPHLRRCFRQKRPNYGSCFADIRQLFLVYVICL